MQLCSIINLRKKYNYLNLTNDVIIELNRDFYLLGALHVLDWELKYLLDNSFDILDRIANAYKVIGTLKKYEILRKFFCNLRSNYTI